MPKKHVVTLSAAQEKEVNQVINRGRELATVRKRSLALQASHLGWSDEEVKKISGLSTSAIARLRKRYAEDGFEKALYCKNKGGLKSPYDAKDEAILIALACSDAPDGRSHWTLALLAEKMSAETGKQIRKSKVGMLLKKMDASPGSRRCGVLPK